MLEAQVENAGPEAPERDLHVVRSDTRRTGRVARRAAYIGPVLVLLSLLAVAGAQTYLTEGQVRLTGLQAAVSAAQTKKLDLELQIANEEQPGAVLAAARALGLVEPTKISELPAVALPGADATTSLGSSSDQSDQSNRSKPKSHKVSGDTGVTAETGESSPTAHGSTGRGSTLGTVVASGTPGAP
jgi:hypothetical protein